VIDLRIRVVPWLAPDLSRDARWPSVELSGGDQAALTENAFGSFGRAHDADFAKMDSGSKPERHHG
jgi:hypothetical protein